MRFVVAGVLLTVGMMIAGCGHAEAPAASHVSATGTEWVSYHEGMRELPDDSVFEEADQRARQEAAELVDWEDGHFADTYVREDSVVVLVATDDRGVALAEAAFAEYGDAVVIERAERNHRQLMRLGESLQEEVPGFGEDVRMVGVNWTGTGLMMEVVEAPTAQDRDGVEAFAEQHRLPLEVYVVEGGFGTLD